MLVAGYVLREAPVPGCSPDAAVGTMQALFAQLQLLPSPLLHHSRPPPSFSAGGGPESISSLGSLSLSKIQFAGKKKTLKNTK